MNARKASIVAARAKAAARPATVTMPAHLVRPAATPLRTGAKGRKAPKLTSTQRDSTGRRSDWSRSQNLRPTETAMIQPWSQTWNNVNI